MRGRVTVIGCGLIGGSLVKRLRERHEAVRVSAIYRQEVLDAARVYLDDGATPGAPAAVALVADSDLVVLATPTSTIVRDIGWVLDAAGPDAVVTDTGSVKQPIVEAAVRHERAARFVGGHPMAGREVGGFDASSSDLFEGARWFVVASASPDGATDRSPDSTVRMTFSDAMARVVELVGAMGAEPIFVDADAHDRAMAYVSHVPQLLASALYGVAARAGVLAHAGAGFRDLTRIAGGPRAMWRDILAANRHKIATALGDVVDPLVRVRDALAQEDEAGLSAALDLLEQAHLSRRALLLSSDRSSTEPLP
jgi:prephenate dehydrogenase